MFHATRFRTKYLIFSFFENFATYWALFRLRPVTFCSPTVSNPTRTASVTSGSDINSAINAIFGIFAGRVYLSTMNNLMTRYTYSQSVVDVKSQCGIVGKRFDMMSMQQPPFLTAFLTSKIISFVDGLTPFRKITRKPSSLRLGGPAMLVSIGLFTRSGFPGTRLAAKFLFIIVGFKLTIAKFAFSFANRAARCPTFFRTIFSRLLSVAFHLECFSAIGAGFSNSISSFLANSSPGAFYGTILLLLAMRVKLYLACLACTGVKTFFIHRDIIPQHNNNTSYAAVTLQRFFDLTNIKPELIK
jgi:hypothetical protein